MSIFFTLLAVALLAYRVFVKGESIIVKTPNWRMRGIAILVFGFSMIALPLYFLPILYFRHIPAPGVLWAMLPFGICGIALGAMTMMRVSKSQ